MEEIPNMSPERKEAIEKMLLVAIDQIERGECEPWKPGDAHRQLDELIRQRLANADPDFVKAAQEVLKKNEELYRRLADSH
jgi:hypothetical protein